MGTSCGSHHLDCCPRALRELLHSLLPFHRTCFWFLMVVEVTSPRFRPWVSSVLDLFPIENKNLTEKPQVTSTVC